MTETRAPSAGSLDPHPSDEQLVAYLAAGLTQQERRSVEHHVAACDGCVQTLIMVHQRLAVAAEVPMPVPDELRRRAAAVPRLPAEDHPTTERSPAGARLAAVLRLPILVPLALAAGALLVVTTQLRQGGEPPRELSRSVPMQQRVRVTAPEAVVRAQPSSHADSLATLTRGAAVDVREEQHDWYRVVLPDGKSGWVERRAFD